MTTTQSFWGCAKGRRGGRQGGEEGGGWEGEEGEGPGKRREGGRLGALGEGRWWGKGKGLSFFFWERGGGMC